TGAEAVPLAGAHVLTAPNGWTLTNVPARYGLAIPSITLDTGAGQARVLVRNTYLRHLAVYVELLADGTPIAPPGWVSRLPAAAQGTLETDTTRFLAILPPARQVAGMPVPSDPVSLSFPVPSWVTGARLVFGGVGIGGYQVMLVAPAALATAVLDYALPAILDG